VENWTEEKKKRKKGKKENGEKKKKEKKKIKAASGYRRSLGSRTEAFRPALAEATDLFAQAPDLRRWKKKHTRPHWIPHFAGTKVIRFERVKRSRDSNTATMYDLLRHLIDLDRRMEISRSPSWKSHRALSP